MNVFVCGAFKQNLCSRYSTLLIEGIGNSLERGFHGIVLLCFSCESHIRNINVLEAVFFKCLCNQKKSELGTYCSCTQVVKKLMYILDVFVFKFGLLAGDRLQACQIYLPDID